MTAICVDDEPLVLQLTVSLCREITALSAVEGFTHAEAALDWLRKNDAQVALLDIDMPDMDGLTLAARIKEARPEISVIFLTGYAQYALDAFQVHASGYLLKPISKERLTSEITYVLGAKQPSPAAAAVAIRTFGNFEILVGGRVVTFDRSKAKELIAYLVDRQGRYVTRAEAFSVLWEDGVYDRSKQKQLDVIIRSLRSTLQAFGIENIFEMKRGMLRICPERVDCDFYRFLKGDADAVNAYRGEYMSSYPWANMTEAFMTRKLKADRDV